nr:uncharacterized protein LOC129262598 [Lytechinus pictus]
MTAKANVKDIQWSRQQYSLREAIKRCTFPQIMKVVEGYESSDETETLARGQILRIHQIHTQTRVLATTDKKGRWLSIPLRYAEARFEVVSSGKRSKAMYMREIIDKSLLPQKVHFFTGDDLTFHLQLKSNVPNAKEKFGALTLQKMYETGYLQGNAIQNDHLDTMILNIPLHSPVSVVLAESFIVGSRERWERYQTLLDKIVSKNVVFELHPGNPHITFFTDKGLESANQQEQYEKITPSGTLFIMTKNERLKQNKGSGSMLSGPSGARTLSAVFAGKAPKDRDNASVQAGERQGRPVLRHAQSDLNEGSSFISSRPRMQSPGRPLSSKVTSVHGTMPRSILKKDSADDRFPPPPAELLMSVNSVHNPMAFKRDNRPQSPPAQQGVRGRTSHSPGRLDARAKSPIRVDYPRPANTSSSPRGSGSSMNSIADSGYSTASSNDPRGRPGGKEFLGKLPDPDYDADPVVANGRGGDFVDHPMQSSPLPPAPPPLGTIPSKQNIPNGVPAAPPPPATAVPGAPPPPPIGFTSPPQPPKYGDVAKIKASQSPSQSPRNKPQMNTGNSRDDMLQELKMKAERRASRLEGLVPSNKPPSFGNKSSPRGSISSPRLINNNNEPSNELQARLAKRFSQAEGAGSEQNSFTKTPPTPAAKPTSRLTNSKTTPVTSKFGTARNSPKTDSVTFDSLAGVPKDLSSLSVSQVCQCLKLMNLEKYSAAFKSNSVDGQLMLQLNQEALVDSFKLNNWDAKRVESFIKGWRPKY